MLATIKTGSPTLAAHIDALRRQLRVLAVQYPSVACYVMLGRIASFGKAVTSELSKAAAPLMVNCHVQGVQNTCFVALGPIDGSAGIYGSVSLSNLQLGLKFKHAAASGNASTNLTAPLPVADNIHTSMRMPPDPSVYSYTLNNTYSASGVQGVWVMPYLAGNSNYLAMLPQITAWVQPHLTEDVL